MNTKNIQNPKNILKPKTVYILPGMGNWEEDLAPFFLKNKEWFLLKLRDKRTDREEMIKEAKYLSRETVHCKAIVGEKNWESVGEIILSPPFIRFLEVEKDTSAKRQERRSTLGKVEGGRLYAVDKRKEKRQKTIQLVIKLFVTRYCITDVAIFFLLVTRGFPLSSSPSKAIIPSFPLRANTSFKYHTYKTVSNKESSKFRET